MIETAILAGGCFWCVEAVFQDLVGVEQLESGYIGGHVPDPTYKQVCGGDTGHAEALRVTYDPTQITYADLLDIFFATHDPTQLNRQGNDIGTQYRSAIFPLDDAQRAEAEAAPAAEAVVLVNGGLHRAARCECNSTYFERAFLSNSTVVAHLFSSTRGYSSGL